MREAVVCTALSASSPGYPRVLHDCLGVAAPSTLHTLGDPALLSRPLLALFSSVRAPGEAILKTYDLARTLRDACVAVIGGFHSPMEKEVLRLLLRGTQPVVVCPARGLEEMRIPRDSRGPLEERRLLLLSPFEARHRRVTAALAAFRNELVAALAEKVFITYAEPGGNIAALAEKVKGWGKPVLDFESGMKFKN